MVFSVEILLSVAIFEVLRGLIFRKKCGGLKLDDKKMETDRSGRIYRH